MKHIRANNILPEELMKEIQKYIQGEYLYIPKEDGVRKKWGTSSGVKKEIIKRNNEIKEKFLDGTSKETLAEVYCLSISSIKKIVYRN